MNVNYYNLIPARDINGNKGTFGKVTVIAGSYGMAGAAYLCSLAVLKSGAGMVRIYTPEANRIILQTLLPEAILTIYDPGQDFCNDLDQIISWSDVIAAGPGLGTSDNSRRLIKELLYQINGNDKNIKLILDADAINIIAGDRLNIPSGAVLTPHMMEMSRLTGLDIGVLKSDGKSVSRKFAEDHECIVVLKDHETIISGNDNRQVINRSGSSALSKAGSGDVLAGTISGLAAQKADLFDAAVLGTYIHGLAGQICARDLTEYGVLARNVAEAIPCALKEIIEKEI